MRVLRFFSIILPLCAALESPACALIGHNDGPGLHATHGASNTAFVVSSADGSSWTEVATDGEAPLSAVAQGAGRF